MRNTFKIIAALLLIALAASLAFSQVRVIEPTPVKVYLHVSPADSPLVNAFKEKLGEKLKERGRVKILESTKGYDYIVSILADTVPELKSKLSESLQISDDTVIPDIFIFSMVITERDSKKTYEKHNLQASFTLESMVDRAYAVIQRAFEKRSEAYESR